MNFLKHARDKLFPERYGKNVPEQVKEVKNFVKLPARGEILGHSIRNEFFRELDENFNISKLLKRFRDRVDPE